MILLRAAALLLLLQTMSAQHRFNKTGCDTTKVCWVSPECTSQSQKTEPPKFFPKEKKEDIDDIDDECSQYLIVEPGLEDYTFEIMLDAIDSTKKVTMWFNSKAGNAYFTCLNHKAATSHNDNFVIHSMPYSDSSKMFCRFKVSKKNINPNSHTGFWPKFTINYIPIGVSLEYFENDIDQKPASISIDNYNEQLFVGRLPCQKSIFIDEKVDGDDYIMRPSHNVISRQYSCPDQYQMSRLMYVNTEPEKKFTDISGVEKIRCDHGKVVLIGGSTGDNSNVASAKCHRPRNTLCDDVCKEGNCPGLTIPTVGGVKSIQCKTRFLLINNGKYITKSAVSCSKNSLPSEHKWKIEEVDDVISDVQCVDELDCNTIYPFGELDCVNCNKAKIDGGKVKCEKGAELVIIEAGSQRKVDITCDRRTGRWLVNGKSQLGSREDIKKIKMGCAGKKPPKDKGKDKQPVGASTGNWLIIGCSLGTILLVLLILLLIYCICCRRKTRKEEPKPEPPTLPTQTRTESSIVEQPISAPQPIAPVSTESENPNQYSGQRVQFINMTQEKLREIEPAMDPTMEYSARDKTDSEKSNASQVGQQTTEGNATVTGSRFTENKTNELSRSVANGDDSRSDASNASKGRNTSWMGDHSRTGGDAPTIGEAAKKKEKKTGPRVAFRERVSYETETNTRSSAASMHTAPEQPQPRVDPTQDDPSRPTADSTGNGFGTKQRTRTTQKTRETNDDANKSGDTTGGDRSRATDISRTG